MEAGARIAAITRIRPPQRSHCSASTAKTRLSNSLHAMRRARPRAAIVLLFGGQQSESCSQAVDDRGSRVPATARKEEVYRVARRHGPPVRVVANPFQNTPSDELIELVVVGDGEDVADDRIAERCGRGDVVVTADIPRRTVRLGLQ